jgi:hypothetical protein
VTLSLSVAVAAVLLMRLAAVEQVDTLRLHPSIYLPVRKL